METTTKSKVYCGHCRYLKYKLLMCMHPKNIATDGVHADGKRFKYIIQDIYTKNKDFDCDCFKQAITIKYLISKLWKYIKGKLG